MSDALAVSDKLYAECEDRTRELTDEEYVDCYEQLISALQSSVDAKKEEMKA